MSNSDNVIIPLALWFEHGPVPHGCDDGLKVWLDVDEEPESIAGNLGRFQMIVLDFPTFTNGYGFGSVHLLHERYGHKGEIRVIGGVLYDQLLSMRHCGFDVYAIHADHSLEDALANLDDSGKVYQASVEQPLPLLRHHG